MQTLLPLAERAAALLRQRQHTIAVAESSAGGLVSAALLAVPGASAYFLGGGVIYTARARQALLGIDAGAMQGLRSASEPYALLLARTMREKLDADWVLVETGAAGPTGNRYGDAAGHSCFAVLGAQDARTRTIETGAADRAANMMQFAETALSLLVARLEEG
jgi:nicotinamide-nucleotide amidase